MAHMEIPADAVVRVSGGTFDPARLEEIEKMRRDTAEFLIPALKRLDGLFGFYAATSPQGSIIDISLWDSDEHAGQLSHLREMAVDARHAAEAVGVKFIPIVHYPLSWQI